jgi:uncharacterized damage-inducible protein DinB
VWLRRWKGTSPVSKAFADEDLTVANLETMWTPIEAETQELVESLTADTLDNPIAYATTRGQPFAEPLWQQMQHLVNHSSYHRGQIVTLLRQLGVSPIGTDLIAYYRGRGR